MKRWGGCRRFSCGCARPVDCPPVRSVRLAGQASVALARQWDVPCATKGAARRIGLQRPRPLFFRRQVPQPRGKVVEASQFGLALASVPAKSPPWTRLRTSTIRLANWEITGRGEAIGPTSACSAGVIRSRNNVRSRFFDHDHVKPMDDRLQALPLQTCFSSNSASSVRKVKLLPAIWAVNSSVFTRTCRGPPAPAARRWAVHCGRRRRRAARCASMAIGRVVEGSAPRRRPARVEWARVWATWPTDRDPEATAWTAPRRRPPPASLPAWTADARWPPPAAAAAALRAGRHERRRHGERGGGSSWFGHGQRRFRQPRRQHDGMPHHRRRRAHRDPPPAASRSSRSSGSGFSDGVRRLLAGSAGFFMDSAGFFGGVLGLLGGVLGLLDRLRGLLRGSSTGVLKVWAGVLAGSVVVLEDFRGFLLAGLRGFLPAVVELLRGFCRFLPAIAGFLRWFFRLLPRVAGLLDGFLELLGGGGRLRVRRLLAGLVRRRLQRSERGVGGQGANLLRHGIADGGFQPGHEAVLLVDGAAGRLPQAPHAIPRLLAFGEGGALALKALIDLAAVLLHQVLDGDLFPLVPLADQLQRRLEGDRLLLQQVGEPGVLAGGLFRRQGQAVGPVEAGLELTQPRLLLFRLHRGDLAEGGAGVVVGRVVAGGRRSQQRQGGKQQANGRHRRGSRVRRTGGPAKAEYGGGLPPEV